MVWDVTQKKFYTEMGQQLEQRTLNVSVPLVNKGSMGKNKYPKSEQMILNKT